jgi:hypothetical protein
MLSLTLGFLSLVPYVLIALFLAFTDYLDWHGRIEVLQNRHPKLAKLIEDKPLRVVLLLMVFGMLAVDLRESIKQFEVEPFVIKVIAAPTADLGAVNPEIAKWKSLYYSVSGAPEPEDSLRRRTIKLANDIDHYVEERWANHPERAYPDPKDTNPTEERKKAIQACLKYDQDTTNFFNDNFKDKWIGIVREYAAKGVKTAFLENDAEQNHPAQYTFFPFAPAREDGTYMSAQSRFRELAYHVDARGNRIDLHKAALVSPQ